MCVDYILIVISYWRLHWNYIFHWIKISWALQVQGSVCWSRFSPWTNLNPEPWTWGAVQVWTQFVRFEDQTMASLTSSLVHFGVTDLLFVILLLYLVATTIIPLTFHYWPLSIPVWSIRSLVLSINIVTLGSSSINYDFILTSYYPSNGCFTWKLGILDYYIVISYFIILYMFHFYLGI